MRFAAPGCTEGGCLYPWVRSPEGTALALHKQSSIYYSLARLHPRGVNAGRASCGPRSLVHRLMKRENRDIMVQRIKLVEFEPAGWLKVKRQVHAMQTWRSVGSHRGHVDQSPRSTGIDPPVVAAKGEPASGAAAGNGTLEFVFPSARSSEVHIHVAVDKVVAVQ